MPYIGGNGKISYHILRILITWSLIAGQQRLLNGSICKTAQGMNVNQQMHCACLVFSLIFESLVAFAPKRCALTKIFVFNPIFITLSCFTIRLFKLVSRWFEILFTCNFPTLSQCSFYDLVEFSFNALTNQ